MGGVYVVYFRHPPAKDILRNQKVLDFGESFYKKSAGAGGASTEEDETFGTEYWDGFLKKNNFVAIGAVYTKCEGRREQVGSVILQEDTVNGGVSSVTFFNMTFGKEISGGQFNIDVKYNGQDLYDNYWELCEMEEDVPQANKTFSCPIQAKHWSIQKEKHIPTYLPKGRFTTKGWAEDEDGEMIACAFADFLL